MRNTYFKRGADIPSKVRNATRWNMKRYNMGLYDAFNLAVRENTEIVSKELYEAWYNSDFRKYIPSAYIPEVLTDEAMEKELYELDPMAKNRQ